MSRPAPPEPDPAYVEEEPWRGPPPVAYVLVGFVLAVLSPMFLALLLAL